MPNAARESAPCPEETLTRLLRRRTSDLHARLEASLDLLSRPVDRQRFVHVLGRFYGFHSVWEYAVRRHAGLRSFQETRTRLPHLRRDLAGLGLDEDAIARLPPCAAGAEPAGCEAGAVGSMYVMEGSTLGGQLIARALAGVDWLPEGGLSYFDPHGPATGRMWREFQDWAETRAPPARRDAAVAGARRTFEVLEAWLT